VSRLDLTSKLNHPTVVDRIRKVRTGEPAGPIVVELDPTSFCNLACPNCVTGDVLNQGRFDQDRLARLANELATVGVLGVILIGGGEPLLHPGTIPLIGRLRALDIRVGIVTNGILVARHAEKLAAWCDWIRVSMDAATSATYAQVRPHRSGRSMFDTALGGIESLIAQSDRRSAVGYSVVVQAPGPAGRPANLLELAAAASIAEQTGCDYIEYKAEMDEHHQIIPLDAECRNLVVKQLELAGRLQHDRFEVCQSSSLKAVLNEESRSGQEKNYHDCPVSALRTTISPSGCYVCSYHRGNSKFSYGDVSGTSFIDVWRDRPSVVDPARDCSFHCARHAMNQAIHSESWLATGSANHDADDIFL
jgi:MoaA/NifB/PqqE/SkfB family radical SAM enzyme